MDRPPGDNGVATAVGVEGQTQHIGLAEVLLSLHFQCRSVEEVQVRVGNVEMLTVRHEAMSVAGKVFHLDAAEIVEPSGGEVQSVPFKLGVLGITVKEIQELSILAQIGSAAVERFSPFLDDLAFAVIEPDDV